MNSIAQNQQNSMLNSNEGASSYNYPSSPGTITGTIRELNQSNPNLRQSLSQNFSSTFSKNHATSNANPGSTSLGQMTSLNRSTVGRSGANNVGGGGTTIGNSGSNGISVSSRQTMPPPKPKETGTSLPMGTKSNNQHDTDSKWTNPYVFKPETTPGSLSSSSCVMDSLKPKWGPSRDELKDQLANSLASDTNVAILPGFSSSSTSGDARRRHPPDSYLYHGEQERPPSAVTRAQNAIGKSRLEIGQAQSLVQNNKARSHGIYRNPRGDTWNTMGTPGPGKDPDSVRRYKQDSYRRDLELQMEQNRVRVAAERKKDADGSDHPLGANYNSFTPNHYVEPPRPPPPTQKLKLEEYNTPSKRDSPRFQDEQVVGKSSRPQRRHFPQGNASPSLNPINPPELTQPPQPVSAPKRQDYYQPLPQEQPQPVQQYPYPCQSYGPSPLEAQAYPQPPQGYAPQAQYYPPPPFQGYPAQQYPGYVQYPHPQTAQPPPIRPPTVSYEHLQPARPPTQIPVQPRPDPPLIRPKSASEKKEFNEFDDASDDDSALRTKIWQTSDQLPDPESKRSFYKLQLKKQIIEKKKEQTEKLRREEEEDRKQELKILEYQAQMRAELEREQRELYGGKGRHRDLALFCPPENLQAADKMRSRRRQNGLDVGDTDDGGGGDAVESERIISDRKIVYAKSESSTDSESIEETRHEISPLQIPTVNPGKAPVVPLQEKKQINSLELLSKIQVIINRESRRIEQKWRTQLNHNQQRQRPSKVSG